MFFGIYCKIFKKGFSYRTYLLAVSETGRKSPAADDHKLKTNNLRYEKNNEQQPVTVSKELHSKNEESNIIRNLLLLAFIIPYSN